MIDYLKQQDRQMMGDALRGNPGGTAPSAGTQIPTAGTSMSKSANQNADMWNANIAQSQQRGNDMSSSMSDFGKWLGKDNGSGQSNASAGWDKITGMFGGSMPSGMGGFGAGSGAGWTGGLDSGGSALGGGGTLTGGGGSAMGGFGAGSGAGWTGGLDSGGSALGGGGGMSGGMGSIYGMMDNMFGDKFYGKQEGNDETSETGDAARSALTSAAYSNPYSAAALWADRLLFKGKGMDTLTGWLD